MADAAAVLSRLESDFLMSSTFPIGKRLSDVVNVFSLKLTPDDLVRYRLPSFLPGCAVSGARDQDSPGDLLALGINSFETARAQHHQDTLGCPTNVTSFLRQRMRE